MQVEQTTLRCLSHQRKNSTLQMHPLRAESRVGKLCPKRSRQREQIARLPSAATATKHGQQVNDSSPEPRKFHTGLQVAANRLSRFPQPVSNGKSGPTNANGELED